MCDDDVISIAVVPVVTRLVADDSGETSEPAVDDKVSESDGAVVVAELVSGSL